MGQPVVLPRSKIACTTENEHL